MRVVKKIILLLFVLSLVLLVVNVWTSLSGVVDHAVPGAQLREKYDPALIRLNSMEKIENHVDSLYNTQSKKSGGFDTTLYISLCRLTVQQRFYHGVSEYSWSNNWIAWLCGELLWSHMKAVVLPNDILKYSYAMCSQQQIVFLELLSRKHISFRTVGLGYPSGPGHFISEVFYKNGWHMNDVDLEPDWEKEGLARSSFDSLLHHPKLFYHLYENKLSKEKSDKLMSRVSYGDKNKLPGGHMQLFHRLCFILIWIMPLILFYLYKKA